MKFSGLIGLLVAFSAPAYAQEARDTAHYVLGVTVSPEHETVAVDASIFPSAVAAGEELEFYVGRTFEIRSAEAGPNARVTARSEGRSQIIRVKFNEAEAAPRIRMLYGGRLLPTGDLPINVITQDLVELNLDSAWLPIRSDYGLRFSVDARIDGIRPDATVVAQGEIRREGQQVHIRRTLREIDFAFAAAPMQRAAGKGFEIFAPDLKSERVQMLNRHASAAIPYLQNWLGKMPADGVRVVVVRRPRTSGYARKGYIVFTEGSRGSEAGVAKFAAHEFAHLWFSNANAQTPNRWLDESMAEYVSLRYVQERMGADALETLLAPKREAAKAAKPVFGDTKTNAELYDKGPLLLFELEEKIGREKMDRLVAAVAMQKIGLTSNFLEVLARLTDSVTAAEFEQKLKS